MGNYVSQSIDESNIQQTTYDLDDMSKTALISYIKNMDIKMLNVDENFVKLTKDIKLENEGLIQMGVELYEKMKSVVPEYKPDETKPVKKLFYVRPEFPLENLINDVPNIVNPEKIYNTEDLIAKKIIGPNNTKHNHDIITLYEYNNAFKDATTKKDMTGLSKKILSNISNYHKTRIINAYNKILLLQYDENTSIGKSTFLYKQDKKGPKNELKSYRQIITIPTLINHFHRILSIRMSEYLNANNYIDKTIQKGGIKGSKHPIFEQIYKVKNVIKDANKRKSKLCVLFLDISNAFGNLNRDKILEILKEYHVDDKFLEYYKKHYENFTYYTKTKDWSEDNIKFKNGIIQGCPLSPVIFVTALNYVLKYVDEKFKEKCGYNINNSTKVLLSAYVDDICIMGNDEISVELVYNELKTLLQKLGLPLNSNKSGLMKINCNDETTSFDNIPVIKGYKYLGEYLSCDGTTTKSFNQFLAILGKKLFIIDVKTNTDVEKMKKYTQFIAPWVQKKLLTLYDLSKNDKLKIARVIKKYTTKWNNQENLAIFALISDIVSESTDDVIKTADFGINDDEIINDNELINYRMDDLNDSMSYSEINAEPNV